MSYEAFVVAGGVSLVPCSSEGEGRGAAPGERGWRVHFGELGPTEKAGSCFEWHVRGGL